MDRRVIAQFWDDCRAAEPLEVHASSGAAGTKGRSEARAVPHPFALVGRDPRDDCRLEHGDVSRHHVYLQVIDGRVFWIDLGSRSGIVREGVMTPSGWLEPGGAIGVGPFLVRAQIGAGGTAAAGPPPPNPIATRGPASWPDASLEFPNRPDGSGCWRLGRMLTLVGRATDCRLRIPDDAISRFHCALLRTPGGVWAVDLLSREGIRVDGARVRFARLADGASLHVGRYRMIVRYTDAPSPSGEAPSWRIEPLAPDQLPAVAARRRPPAPLVEVPLVERPPSSLTPADLDPFVARFEQMQQQMFEQFHQAMMTMFQGFGAMHRDQMGQVREELDRIRDLSRELQGLQEHASRPTAEAESAPEPPSAESRPRERRAPPSGPSEPARPPTGPEIHDLISRKIALLQDERQGRWKRVLDLISGGSAG